MFAAMPRIKAASIAEHRDAQRRAVLDAARRLLITEGPEALGFGKIAKASGLARPTVYEYFRTKGDLVLALIDDELPAWRRELEAAITRAPAPELVIDAFVRAQLRLVADGRHELPFALAHVVTDDAAAKRIAEVHSAIFGMLAPALRAMGVADTDEAYCLELVATAVMAAVRALRRGADLHDAAEATARFVVGGVRATAAREAGRPARGRRRP